MMEKTIAMAEIEDYNDCGHGKHSPLYYCVETDSCCSHTAANGRDDDWWCCDADTGNICAPDADGCDNDP